MAIRFLRRSAASARHSAGDDACDYFGMTTAANYAAFAARETRGVSPIYERLSVAVSRDDEVLALLGTLPPAKRQPNLLFGVVRLLGGPDPRAALDRLYDDVLRHVGGHLQDDSAALLVMRRAALRAHPSLQAPLP